MYLVNIEKETIQECIILEKKTGYTILQIGNEIFGLPSEDSNCYLFEDKDKAEEYLILQKCGCWFVPQ